MTAGRPLVLSKAEPWRRSVIATLKALGKNVHGVFANNKGLITLLVLCTTFCVVVGNPPSSDENDGSWPGEAAHGLCWLWQVQQPARAACHPKGL